MKINRIFIKKLTHLFILMTIFMLALCYTASVFAVEKSGQVLIKGDRNIALNYAGTDENTYFLKAKVYPSNSEYQKITWTSSDENVAVVDNTGKVIATGLGVAEITASQDEYGWSDSVTVYSYLAMDIDTRDSWNEMRLVVDNNAPETEEIESDSSILGQYIFNKGNLLESDKFSGNMLNSIDKMSDKSVEQENEYVFNAYTIQKLMNLYMGASMGEMSGVWTVIKRWDGRFVLKLKDYDLALGLEEHNGVKTLKIKTFDVLDYDQSWDMDYIKSVESVAIENKADVALDFYSGSTYQCQFTVYPEDAIDKNVKWSSSNDSVASVDENGIITANGMGSAVITVTTEDGNKSDSINVYCYQGGGVTLPTDNWLRLKLVCDSSYKKEVKAANVMSLWKDAGLGDSSQWTVMKIWDGSYIFKQKDTDYAVAAETVNGNRKLVLKSLDAFDQSQRWYIEKFVVQETVAVHSIAPASPLTTSIYPNMGSSAYGLSNPYYIAGFGGQCTAFAWGRAKEKLGINLPFLHDAIKWWNENVTYNYFSYGTEPRANSIAVWDTGSFGHVAYVEAVDGDNIIFNEGNWSGPGYNGAPKTLSSSEFYHRNKNWKLKGYIYIGK